MRNIVGITDDKLRLLMKQIPQIFMGISPPQESLEMLVTAMAAAAHVGRNIRQA